MHKGHVMMVVVWLSLIGVSFQVCIGASTGFVRVPEGEYSRGSHQNEEIPRIQRTERPVHDIYVSVLRWKNV